VQSTEAGPRKHTGIIISILGKCDWSMTQQKSAADFEKELKEAFSIFDRVWKWSLGNNRSTER
jgi:hypothetical protein